MGVPGWLLNIVMGFLKERAMVIKFKGETSETQQLPGGGPQGTLLGLLLFLILINLCGLEAEPNQIGHTITNPKKKFAHPTLHTKYIDDLLIAEALNLKETLINNPIRPLPDPYHARLGLKLDPQKSRVYSGINGIIEYAENNEMRINYSKTKFMVFNPTLNHDFIPEFNQGSLQIETMEEMKLLGLIVSNDLTWKRNTEYLTKKAYQKLWSIKRLIKHGASIDDIVDIYEKQVRSVLEFGVPVWNSGITKEESLEIERVQNSFLHIVLQNL